MQSLKLFIAKRIKYLRKENGMSQEKLSELSNLPDTYINKIENGRINLQVDTLEKVIQGLEINYDEFFQAKFVETSGELNTLITSLEKLPMEQQKACLKAFQLLVEQMHK
ncbi:helix-turn-helix transcriptional regulator [Enterococcus faecalis]|nr:helix-turn-helix transcriptional regulator [Enterococcus faecalis]